MSVAAGKGGLRLKEAIIKQVMILIRAIGPRAAAGNQCGKEEAASRKVPRAESASNRRGGEDTARRFIGWDPDGDIISQQALKSKTRE